MNFSDCRRYVVPAALHPALTFSSGHPDKPSPARRTRTLEGSDKHSPAAKIFQALLDYRSSRHPLQPSSLAETVSTTKVLLQDRNDFLGQSTDDVLDIVQKESPASSLLHIVGQQVNWSAAILYLGQQAHRSKGQLVNRSTGQLVNRSTGQLVNRSIGRLVNRPTGQQVNWSTGQLGQLVHRSTGQQVHWSTGQLINRSTGPQVNWSTGQLVNWSTGQLANNHSVLRSTGQQLG